MDHPICWQNLITELEGADLSLVEIGKRIGLSTSSVSDIKRGASKEPRGTAAVRLFQLHRDLVSPTAPAAVEAQLGS